MVGDSVRSFSVERTDNSDGILSFEPSLSIFFYLVVQYVLFDALYSWHQYGVYFTLMQFKVLNDSGK